MGMVFIFLTLPCSSQPTMTPTNNIMNISKALDIDSVQNKKVSSIVVTFWMMNNTAMPARIKTNMSLKLIASPPFFKLCFDGFVKSRIFVIPAKAGHAVKRQRYPELFDNTGFPPSRE
jgi:hypothetical protein